MGGFYTYLFLFYAVAFASLAFLPRWWLLVPGAIAAFALAAWVFNDLDHADGPGVMFAIPIVALGALGFLSGGLARALLLVAPRFRSWTVLPVFFFGAPAAAWGWSAWVLHQGEMRRAAPVAACSRELHPATLAGVALSLPLVPVLHVGGGREYVPAWHFSINEHMRKFCAENPPEGMTLTNLSVDFERPEDRYAPGVTPSRYCSAGSEPWRPLMCRIRDTAPPTITPPGEAPSARPTPPPDPTPLVKMAVYVLGEYDAGKMHAFAADSAPMLLAEAARLPATPVGDGIEMHAAGTSQIYLTRPGEPAFAARCSRSTNPGRQLYCTTGEHLSPKLGLIYGFYAPDKTPAKMIARARGDAIAIWESFRRR